jgi:glycosyltransferase involved in cell wall biosynthesis
MADKLGVCLLNDSFPPTLDGVANTVLNYAEIIQNKLGRAIVATPSWPNVADSYSYPVVRYPSIDITKSTGYRAGLPFNPATIKELTGFKPDILHSHCPIASTYLARTVCTSAKVPIVLTYHSKFDVDIAGILKSKLMQSAAINLLVKNVKACDEIWVVSRGSGENLRGLGYQGDYIIMENGVDFPQGKADPDSIAAVRRQYGLEDGIPVFLTVGRMKWYKGFRLILDGLKIVRSQGLAFRMVFVGDGGNFEEIRDYTEKLGLSDICIFTGAIRDRTLLRTFYSMSDLFLLPSVFDNRPIVVLEAAACGLASLLIRGSSSAEIATDDHNALLIDENAEALAQCAARIIKDRSLGEKLGRNAQEELYISWEDAVTKAYQRYFTVIENYRKKNTDKHRRPRALIRTPI